MSTTRVEASQEGPHRPAAGLYTQRRDCVSVGVVWSQAGTQTKSGKKNVLGELHLNEIPNKVPLPPGQGAPLEGCQLLSRLDLSSPSPPPSKLCVCACAVHILHSLLWRPCYQVPHPSLLLSSRPSTCQFTSFKHLLGWYQG